MRMQDLQQPDQALSSVTGASGSRRDRVGAPAIVLAGHLLNSLVGNSEIRRSVGFAIPAKIPAKRTAAVGASANFTNVFKCVARIPRKNPESNQWLKLLLLLMFFRGAPGRQSLIPVTI